jgi:hypothetical protein
MRSRYPGLEKPMFIGFIDSGSRNGSMFFSADCTRLSEASEEGLLDYLAAGMHAGRSPDSIFMRTWRAGLAYSNGLYADEVSGRLVYSAERCADLSDTIRFVVSALREAPDGRHLIEQAMASSFSRSRRSASYESRGIAMAADLADGITPALVERFRRSIIELRDKRNLSELLIQRKERVYGKVLIGYGGKSAEGANAIYFMVGPEAQCEGMEAYLESLGAGERVYRLFPRDFWITDRSG